jgi:hypothetical protein
MAAISRVSGRPIERGCVCLLKAYGAMPTHRAPRCSTPPVSLSVSRCRTHTALTPPSLLPHLSSASAGRVINSRPRWWYVVLVNCGGGNTASDGGSAVGLEHYELLFTNGGYPAASSTQASLWTYQFSADQTGVYEMTVAFYVLSVGVFVLIFWMKRLAKSRKKQYEVTASLSPCFLPRCPLSVSACPSRVVCCSASLHPNPSLISRPLSPHRSPRRPSSLCATCYGPSGSVPCLCWSCCSTTAHTPATVSASCCSTTRQRTGTSSAN